MECMDTQNQDIFKEFASIQTSIFSISLGPIPKGFIWDSDPDDASSRTYIDGWTKNQCQES